MITRQPSAATRAAVPNLIQLTSAFEKSPWSRMIGAPSPISSHASRTPSRASKNFGSRSEEHTTELQSLMRISYAVFCLNKKKLSAPATHYSNPHTHTRQCKQQIHSII